MSSTTADVLRPHVKPGVTTDHIDRMVFHHLTSQGAYPSSLWYGPADCPFPKSICTSINEVREPSSVAKLSCVLPVRSIEGECAPVRTSR